MIIFFFFFLGDFVVLSVSNVLSVTRAAGAGWILAATPATGSEGFEGIIGTAGGVGAVSNGS